MTGAEIFAIIIPVVYYIITATLTFFAAFGVYILLRYGPNRLLSLVVSAAFSLFFLLLLSQSYSSLLEFTKK